MWFFLCFALGALFFPYFFIYEDFCEVEMMRVV